MQLFTRTTNKFNRGAIVFAIAVLWSLFTFGVVGAQGAEKPHFTSPGGQDQDITSIAVKGSDVFSNKIEACDGEAVLRISIINGSDNMTIEQPVLRVNAQEQVVTFTADNATAVSDTFEIVCDDHPIKVAGVDARTSFGGDADIDGVDHDIFKLGDRFGYVADDGLEIKPGVDQKIEFNITLEITKDETAQETATLVTTCSTSVKIINGGQQAAMTVKVTSAQDGNVKSYGYTFIEAGKTVHDEQSEASSYSTNFNIGDNARTLTIVTHANYDSNGDTKADKAATCKDTVVIAALNGSTTTDDDTPEPEPEPSAAEPDTGPTEVKAPASTTPSTGPEHVAMVAAVILLGAAVFSYRKSGIQIG